MLVVTSNWCVPDGSISAGPARGVIDRFRAEVRRASLRAGVRSDGRYLPVAGIAVIFAGDTFDWLTSREWSGTVRPWETGARAAAARERVAEASLRRARRLIAILAAWGRRGLEVPAADSRGRPLVGSVRRVPVTVTLLRGDRDRWIDSLPPAGNAASAIVSTGANWTDGDVLVRHGEGIEFLWHDTGREPTLGESLAIELIARFGGMLGEVAEVGPRAGALLYRLVAGRLVDAPQRLSAWLAARERDGTLSPSARQAAGDAWHRSVDAWHRAAWRLGLGGGQGVDLLGRLAAGMALGGSAASRARGDVRQPTDRDPMHLAGRVVDEATHEILGHPPAGFVPPAAWRRRVECLGPVALASAGPWPAGRCKSAPLGLALLDPPGMIPRHAVNDEQPAPAAVVVGAGPNGRELDWLQIEGGRTHTTEHEATARGIIWRSHQAGEGRVVDAA